MGADLRRLGVAVKRLQARHHREGSQGLAAHGVTLPQWDMLRQLNRHPDASLHDLAIATFQTDQSAGALAARMVAKGLLERVEGPGRAVQHRVTTDGHHVLEQGQAIMDDVLQRSVGQLSSADQATLLRLLDAAYT